MIKQKIYDDVPDSVCEICPQNYEDECRAFRVPHSVEEYAHRDTGGAKCILKKVQEMSKPTGKARKALEEVGIKVTE